MRVGQGSGNRLGARQAGPEGWPGAAHSDADACEASSALLVIEPALGVITWANVAACRLLALPIGIHAEQLDQSMPALQELRRLSPRSLPATGTLRRLVFWTAGGIRALDCTCRPASRAGESVAILIEARPAGGGSSLRAETPAHLAAATPACRAASMGSSQDAAALAEIARQIRRGVGSRISLGLAPDTDSLSASGSLDVRTRARALPQLARLIEAIPTPLALARAGALAHANRALLTRLGFASPAEIEERVGSLAAAADGAGKILLPSRGGTYGLMLEPHAMPGAENIALLLPVEQAQPTSGEPTRSPEVEKTERDMLARVSHELRTPLTSIMGFAEVMREERLGAIGTPRYKGYAGDIYDSAAHALSLVDDLLATARAEALGAAASPGAGDGKVAKAAEPAPQPAPLEIGEVISASLASLEPIAAKAQVSLSMLPLAPLPRVAVERRGLRQMLLNLLSNAIKATRPGGAVWATADHAPGGPLVILVQDTGAGMDPHEVATALEPWGQVGPKAGLRGGSGLGLPLTAEIAAANGARLEIESAKGRGTAALIVFPPERLAEK
jgi:signal transduction histidine kinase